MFVRRVDYMMAVYLAVWVCDTDYTRSAVSASSKRSVALGDEKCSSRSARQS